MRSEPFERFKALILTGHNHPAHDWRATTAALILALEQDPRAIVHVTENIDDLATSRPTPDSSQEGKRAQSRAGTLPSAGGAGGPAVELRSADFSPPPSGLAKSAGSGMPVLRSCYCGGWKVRAPSPSRFA